MLYAFYRQEHVYDVLSEFSRRYTGDFSILEFGVADGYSFTRKLYATRYLKVEDRVTVHGFDSFEGMPGSEDDRDQDVIADDGWVEGQFAASYYASDAYCKARCRNYRLHRDTFETTLNDQVLAEFERRPPILVWIDCDYYTSARVVFERLIPYIPSGCVIYFDEYEFNHGSRFTGRRVSCMRSIRVNLGRVWNSCSIPTCRWRRSECPDSSISTRAHNSSHESRRTCRRR